MSSRPRRFKALDLFCKAGGVTKGLQRAGFYVVGVDIEAQPRYCGDEFHRADALTFDLSGFDFIWASPPCQGYSLTSNLWVREHPKLIEETRGRLQHAGVPYVIENVAGAPLHAPMMLCGAQLGLKTYRHRFFESNVMLVAPGKHPRHVAPVVKAGRPPCPGDFINPVGHFSGVAYVREVMGIPWMTRDELAQAIPPDFAEFLGCQVMAYLIQQREAAA